jgi:hypothetical protein
MRSLAALATSPSSVAAFKSTTTTPSRAWATLLRFKTSTTSKATFTFAETVGAQATLALSAIGAILLTITFAPLRARTRRARRAHQSVAGKTLAIRGTRMTAAGRFAGHRQRAKQALLLQSVGLCGLEWSGSRTM